VKGAPFATGIFHLWQARYPVTPGEAQSEMRTHLAFARCFGAEGRRSRSVRARPGHRSDTPDNPNGQV